MTSSLSRRRSVHLHILPCWRRRADELRYRLLLLLRLIDFNASIEDIFVSSLVGRSERVLSSTMQVSSLVNFSVNFGNELFSD